MPLPRLLFAFGGTPGTGASGTGTPRSGAPGRFRREPHLTVPSPASWPPSLRLNDAERRRLDVLAGKALPELPAEDIRGADVAQLCRWLAEYAGKEAEATEARDFAAAARARATLDAIDAEVIERNRVLRREAVSVRRAATGAAIGGEG